MRTAFVQILYQLAERDERIWLLTGDLGYSVLEPFAGRFPERFINVGIAEQNMVGVASGLALCGKVVFTYSIANFPTLRCLEQIRNDVCFHNANVKIVAVGGGLTYGSLGHTHHALEDLAVMRAMPNMVVLAPGDPVETRLAIRAVVDRPGPCYLRLGKAGEPTVHSTPPVFEIGKAIVLRQGTDVTLISTGGMLKTVTEAAENLAEDGISACVVSMHTVKPLDESFLKTEAARVSLISTIEEHSEYGGLSDAVAQCLSRQANVRCKFVTVNLTELPGNRPTGSQSYMRNSAGLAASQIRDTVIRGLSA